MSNLPGLSIQNLTLIILSYLLLLLINNKTRSDSALLLVAVLTFHHVVAYLYAFHISLPENEVDPATFLLKAERCMNLDHCGYLGYHLYVHFLAKGIELGGSLYFVFLLNVLFFVVSIYFFIKIKEILDLRGGRKISLFLYGMWPSVVYYTTLHYREPFELYLLIIGLYFAFSGSKKDSFIQLFFSMLSLLLMGVFHIKGLLLLSPVLFLLASTYKMKITVVSILKRLLLAIVMIVCVYFSYTMYTKNLISLDPDVDKPSLTSIISERIETLYEVLTESESLELGVAQTAQKAEPITKSDPEEKPESAGESGNNYKVQQPQEIPSIIDRRISLIMAYRSILLGEREVRTAFMNKLNAENLLTFTLSFSQVYMEYLFSPFVFQVTSLNTLLAYAESSLRLLLFISSLILFIRVPQVRILFIIYLMITAMWTIGVVSFGASIRHHIQTNWILVILGVPLISGFFGKKLSQRREQKVFSV